MPDRKRPTRPRMTIPAQLVLRALLAEPTQEMYGLQICARPGCPRHHPPDPGPPGARARLAGIPLGGRRPGKEGRPRRRYYRLTEDGAERARIALAHATTSTAGLRLAPRPADGADEQRAGSLQRPRTCRRPRPRPRRCARLRRRARPGCRRGFRQRRRWPAFSRHPPQPRRSRPRPQLRRPCCDRPRLLRPWPARVPSTATPPAPLVTSGHQSSAPVNAPC